MCLWGHSFCVLVKWEGGRNPEIKMKKSKSKSLLDLAAPSILYMTQQSGSFPTFIYFFIPDMAKNNKVIGYFLFTILVWSMGQGLYWHILRLGGCFF